MVESLHKLAGRVKNFILNSDLIEDVYATDEEIIESLVPSFRSFRVQQSRF